MDEQSLNALTFFLKHAESVGVVGVLGVVVFALYKKNEKLENTNASQREESLQKISEFERKFEKTDEKISEIRGDVKEVKTLLRLSRGILVKKRAENETEDF